MIWKFVFLLWIFGAAAVDLSTYKIPNRLCLCMAGNGVLMQAYMHGVKGIGEACIGMGIPFAALFVLFAVRVLGAGDIKLLCAAGAFVGRQITTVLMYTCICAGVAAVVRLAYLAGRKEQRMQDECVQENNRNYGMKKSRNRMHMSIPIACGCVIYMMGGFGYGI